MNEEKSGFIFQWEKQAANGEPMPDGLSLPEQYAYQALSYLYGRHKLKLISKEQGKTEKGKIIYQYMKMLESEKHNSDMVAHTARLWKDIEHAHNRYRKNSTLENADLMSAVLDGLVRDIQKLIGDGDN